ncbi:ribonuclease Y [Rubrivirga marina]|uniref:Ribonuclease Y n=1 Tax=Rubrivirga marina TaxID=1196024 RepID=A0A271J546_9BACT|nr:ribonuclease Y [Rubrivirga marina]
MAVGFIGGRVRSGGTAAAQFEAAARRAEDVAARAEAEADRFQERAEAAQSELATARDEVRRRRARLETRVAEVKERHQKTRDKLDAARARVDKKAKRVAARESALETAADALDALTAAAERRRAEADTLREQVQGLATSVGRRQQELAGREREVDELQAHLDEATARLDQLVKEHLAKLEQTASLSREEARDRLVAELTREAKLEAAGAVKDARDEAKRTAQREATKVILKAIQRLAATATIEHTVSAVPLKSDDMKGRVIGREGRNIRAFEAATGVEVIVDDTPDAVLVSGFDPVRREVARLALVRLLDDGRIHPARIEEVVEATREEIDAEIVEAGEQAALDLQIHGLHPELIRLVGRMKYRASYGQNLLQHSVETAKLAGLMAAELGLDARKARRAGLLHDIGKVIEGDLEQPHAIAGMELARQYKEHPDVANAVGAHHDEVPMATPIAPIVQAADAASGARPGARREALERYVQRLKGLEGIASDFEGVLQAYAIQAGREIRVVVDTERVSDAVAETLARDISRRIEREMEYPGQIKVTVIREVRAVAVAR